MCVSFVCDTDATETPPPQPHNVTENDMTTVHSSQNHTSGNETDPTSTAFMVTVAPIFTYLYTWSCDIQNLPAVWNQFDMTENIVEADVIFFPPTLKMPYQSANNLNLQTDCLTLLVDMQGSC